MGRRTLIGTSCGAAVRDPADVAQLVEHFTRNEGVPGSSPGVGFRFQADSMALHGLSPGDMASPYGKSSAP